MSAVARMAAPSRSMVGRLHSSARRGLLPAGAFLVALAWPARALFPSAPQAAPPAPPDRVLWRNARGQVNTLTGKVTANSLTEVVIETGSSQRKLAALEVERVVFGDAPQSYHDAEAYLARGDLENAAAKFSLAASDAAARPLVRARARLGAAQAWLGRGALDAAGFAGARKECEQFLAEHPENRDVPQVKLLLGRARRLSGDAAGAAETYAALYREGTGPQAAAGFPLTLSFRAGLAAADAYLAAGDTAKARELYLGLDGVLAAALAGLETNDPRRAPLTAVQAEARLGEGYCLLAAGSLSQAKTFFQGQLSGADGSPPRRFGAQLGLGEVLLAEGNSRAAQIEFAQVSAIDHTDRDRVARALVGLARAALVLSARDDAKLLLDTVRTQYGDTPAVLQATELLQTL